jgi:ubiquinone/menaquinone biosynthesis C-methylase UbiE
MFMSVKQAYNNWASQYDTNENKTRDLEANVLREVLSEIPFTTCLEIGCGTGKNTEWLVTKANKLTSVDLSDEMLAKAKEKITSPGVQFIQADILQPWQFGTGIYDLVTFSLVLEHINNLEPVFKEASAALKTGGFVYVGELHPFKQYAGSKARFETSEGLQIVECYNHNISDFIIAGKNSGLEIYALNEFFDDNDRTQLPRILNLVMRKR